MSKLSVIIPLYKGQNTLRAALHSIAMQSIIDDTEIIIVNDGDKIDYSDILSRFSDLDIKYIVRERNGGCAAARNTGIKESSTPFCTFVDSDDTFSNCLTLEIMYNKIKAEKVDMLVGDFESEMRQDNGIAIKKIEKSPVWCHNKYYRRQFLLDNNLFFNEKLRINEDMEFHQLLIDMGGKVTYVPFCGYMWRDNAKSVTHESLYKNKRTFVDACAEYIKDCNKRGLMNERVVRRVIQNLVVVWQYYNVCIDECEDKADEFMSACREYWKLAEPIVADVPDELVTKVYCGIAKTFEFIPSVGFIEFLNELRAG